MTRVHSDAEGVSVPTCDGETIAAHTPGPWKVFLVERGPNKGHLLGVGEMDGSGVTDAYGGLWGSGGEKLANAYLIAAAPEMLEALRWAENTIIAMRPTFSQVKDEGHAYHDQVLDTVRAAIRKATTGDAVGTEPLAAECAQ